MLSFICAVPALMIQEIKRRQNTPDNETMGQDFARGLWIIEIGTMEIHYHKISGKVLRLPQPRSKC